MFKTSLDFVEITYIDKSQTYIILCMYKPVDKLCWVKYKYVEKTEKKGKNCTF